VEKLSVLGFSAAVGTLLNNKNRLQVSQKQEFAKLSG
jgi:hypothetical protein